MDSREDIHLLVELDPEAARWRTRTMFLLSILLHFVLVGVLLSVSSMIREHERVLELEAEAKPPEQPTFLFLPPDLQKRLRQEQKTNSLSDQNRQKQGKAPVVTPSAPPLPYSPGKSPLPEIAGGGKPVPPAPPPPAPTPPKAAASGGGTPGPPPPPKQDDTNALKLEDVPKPAGSNSQLALSTPGEMIQQSMQAAARGRAAGQYSGPGDSPGQFSNPYSNFSTAGPIILSDTRGVDFGPYLARIVYTVRQNWYAVIPESARLGEKGKVALDFDIQKDGSVPDIDTAASSGSDPLDRAARAGIRASIPFPPLPAEFTGNHLKLRFIFLYNLGYGPQ